MFDTFLILPFKEMEDIVDQILAAKEEEEKVLIFGDPDVDRNYEYRSSGKGLSQLGIAVTWKLPIGDDPYHILQFLTMGYIQSIILCIYTL